MQITIENLCKFFGKVRAVDNLNLDIKDKEFVAFLGPSGCGKTTTLLMIAGIYKPSAGRILFDGRVVNHLLPKERNIGMVFQSYALYPHMTVFENIAYPLTLKKVRGKEKKQRVQRVADMMGIGELLDRKPAQLSGGQQQRVAVARALVKEPAILLFDEPLSNLDAKLRLRMRGEIKRLQEDLSVTSIYVTHDQVEAMTMASRIAVMNHGVLQAYGTPDRLYNHPDTLFVAGFIGAPPMNLLKAHIERDEKGIFLVRAEFKIQLPEAVASSIEQSNFASSVIMGIRPEDVHIVSENAGDFKAEIYVVEPLGREELVTFRLGDDEIRALVAAPFVEKEGATVGLKLARDRLHIFDSNTGTSLL